MEKQKINRWIEDVTIAVSRDARAKLKMKALKRGLTLKALLDEYANIK